MENLLSNFRCSLRRSKVILFLFVLDMFLIIHILNVLISKYITHSPSDYLLGFRTRLFTGAQSFQFSYGEIDLIMLKSIGCIIYTVSGIPQEAILQKTDIKANFVDPAIGKHNLTYQY